MTSQSPQAPSPLNARTPVAANDTQRRHAPRVDWDTPIACEPLTDILDRSVERFPDNTYLSFMGRTWSYAEIGTLVDKAARGFQQMGVAKGDRIGLCLPNTPYYTICYFAALKVGAIVVNYNPLYVKRELAYQINDSGTRFMVTLDLQQIYPKVAAMLDSTPLERIVICAMQDILPTVKGLLFAALKRSEVAEIPDDPQHLTFEQLTSNDGAFRPVAVEPLEDIAVLQYTGGTTGTPKGAMLTHANLSANADQLRRWFWEAETGKEKILAVLPFFHVFAMTVVQNLGTRLGAELVLLPRFEMTQFLKTITRTRPTLMAGVPTIYGAVNAYPELAKYDLSSLKYCISGGAPLPIEVKHRFEELTGCHLVEGYGLSECSPVSHCNPIGGLNKEGAIGISMPWTGAEIRDLLDADITAPDGEKGELVLRGPQVMKGYWQRPEDTDAAIGGGWLRTGDVGYRDEDGYIVLVDRIKDVILAGGYNVYPRIIEEALYLHPAVAEVVCIGIPDDYRGQAPKCFVRLKDDADVEIDDLKAFLTDKLSRIEMPKDIEIRDELPKTMVGKLSKKELVAEEMARHTSPENT